MLSKFLTLLSIWLLLWTGSLQASFTFDEDVSSVRIPVTIKHNIILLPIRINGSFEMNFILDTGVRTTILTEPMVAGFLSLDSLSRVKVRGLGEGDAIDAILSRNVSMKFEGVTGEGIKMIVLPEGVISYSGMFGEPVYGIIGYEIFGQFVVEINYAQKHIVLHDPFSFRYRGKGDIIPINIKRSKPYVQATLFDHRGKANRSEWLLDTGASQAVALFDSDMPKPPKTLFAFLGQGLSGAVFGKLGRVGGFQIGDYFFEDVIAGFPDASSINMIAQDTIFYGNLGAEILSRFKVVFDYHRQRIILQKSQGFNKPFSYNVSGIEIVSGGRNFNRYRIIYIRPGSPADEAGLKVNDELVALNGFAVNGLNIDEVYNRLTTEARRRMKIKVKRDGEIIKFKFRMESEL